MWGCVVGGAWAYIEGVCYEVDWEGVDGGGGVDIGRYVCPHTHVLRRAFWGADVIYADGIVVVIVF